MDSDSNTEWIRLADATDVADNSAIHIEVGELPVCLARNQGRLHAIVDRCTHQDVPLSEGDVEDGTIECYMHGSRFDLETGRVLGPPATEDVAVFPVRVDGEDVYALIDRTMS
jgi:3-phenylpropionate/trans-cinnamate dioxygenase ferredoxin subunit